MRKLYPFCGRRGFKTRSKPYLDCSFQLQGSKFQVGMIPEPLITERSENLCDGILVLRFVEYSTETVPS